LASYSTNSSSTDVISAKISGFTGSTIGHSIYTASSRVTRISCTWVIVIAVDKRTTTHTILITDFICRTGVTIIARTHPRSKIAITICATEHTYVTSARVAIVTNIVIDHIVAIIINSIAYFVRRDFCVANITKSAFATFNSNANANIIARAFAGSRN